MRNKKWITDKLPPICIPILVKSCVGISIDTYHDLKYFKNSTCKIYGWHYLNKDK